MTRTGLLPRGPLLIVLAAAAFLAPPSASAPFNRFSDVIKQLIETRIWNGIRALRAAFQR